MSSHAVRAIETSKIFAHALKYKIDHIKADTHLYYTDGEGIINQFYDLPDRYNSIMIVGHNPALSDFINRYLRDPIDHLPTSGIVSISFLTEQWDQVPMADFEVNFALFPKELRKKDEIGPCNLYPDKTPLYGISLHSNCIYSEI